MAHELYTDESRRKFLLRGCLFALGSLAVLEACTAGDTNPQSSPSDDPCADYSGLNKSDLQARKGLAYVNPSPQTDLRCDNWKYWLAPKENKTCGACLVFKGPVHASGYCTYWADVVA